MSELTKIFLSLVLCAAFVRVTYSADRQKKFGTPVAAPPYKLSSHMSTWHHSYLKGSDHASNSHPQSSAGTRVHSPASAPYLLFSPSYHPARSYSPTGAYKHKKRLHPNPPFNHGPSLSPLNAPSPSPSPSPSPTSTADIREHIYPPALSPKKPTASWPQTVRGLPPPPPNLDCSSIVCTEPLTNTSPGSPCSCVMPMKVGLQLNVVLHEFFPLVSELAQEIASGVLMELSQVRIMGANAASGEPDKTVVFLNLVPRGEKFDNSTAFSTYHKLCNKQISIKASYFGNYDVLYVLYPGLPPPSHTAPGRVFGYDNNPMIIHPFAVDVNKPEKKQKNALIAVIVLSSIIVLVLCVGLALALFLWRRYRAHRDVPISQASLPHFDKSLENGIPRYGSRLSSGSWTVSMRSTIATHIGPVKTFSLSEIEGATNKFNDSRIIGEGGFGLVYEGTLDDGTQVAVKVLKRDDQQGVREFLAEVDMLSRLHHRNLVKLLGICTEESVRCLIYELVPNGSVESHLFGSDKETAPLDWNSRMKIALGTARCLAYLHEDSNPHVIHRDFKSSNILLEHDFTPKLCDFGLARTAPDSENTHISTRVMGTFGYVAPEYAMTGHLLVKSDVYSYGVVLLELLTGRKPVDMLRPPGQENLVAWARPLLTSKEGLETVVDPSLGTSFPFDSLAQVAVIASMCIQPEVSQRPFMGEVVQALKLVCSQSSEHIGSVSCSKRETDKGETTILSTSDFISVSERYTRDESGSFRRYSSSGPLRTGKSKQLLMQWVRGLSGGSVSEHGTRWKSLEGSGDWR